MGKISKLMKLLSASAVVAGANSVVLADCGLCGERSHDRGTCPHFDYQGYGQKIGYYGSQMKPKGEPLTESDKNFIGQVADNAKDKKEVLRNFLKIPTSSIVSFPTPSDTSGSTDTGSTTSYDNTWSNTEAASQNSNEKSSASDKINALKFEQTRHLEDSATMVSESDATEMEREEAAIKTQNARRDQLAHREVAHRRDTQRVNEMMRERVAEEPRKHTDRQIWVATHEKGVAALEENLQHRGAEEAKDVAYDNRANINISDMKKFRIIGKNLSEADKRREARAARKELAQQQKAQQSDGASELRDINEAAKEIQNAARARLARKKAAHLKEEQVKRDAAAKKITDALRANKERNAKRRETERQAQNRFDELLAEQEQLRENLAAEPLSETQNGADFEYQINADDLLAQQEQARDLGMNTQEQSHTTAIEGAVVADEKVKKERWSLPHGMSYTFTAAFNLYNGSARKRAERWALQLKDLSIRQIECIFWLITTSYQQLQNAGKFAPTAQMAEAISDVDNIFPYSGTNSGVIDVYNAWENTDTADFVKDLERLGSNGLDGVLYYVAFRYMQLLDDRENQKQAASSKFVELAKAVLEHFDISWNTEDVKFVPDNKDVREAPRDPVNFKAADNGIVETEAPETVAWNPPYRVYYAYCNEIRRGLRPSSKSMRLFQDKENRAQLYQDELSKLTIRRLEAIIHLAATAYECRDIDGHVDINKAIKDVRNVFPESGQPQPNARLVNVCNAIDNMVDKPNDNPISMQPFQKGFTALTTYEQKHAFIDMAIAYRKKLREGKRPASMAFVRLADAICEVSGNDGFVDGKDNAHPKLKFEEFENEAKTAQVSDTANAENGTEIVAENREEPTVVTATEHGITETEPEETSEWDIPYGLHEVYRKTVNIHEQHGGRRDLLAQWGGELRALSIRRLEVVMYLAAYQYGGRDKKEVRTQGDAHKFAMEMCDLFPVRETVNPRLVNCYHALENKRDALVEFSNGYYEQNTWEGSFQGGFRRLKTSEAELVLGEIAFEYLKRLHEGKRPSHMLFVKFADAVCKGLNLGWMSEEDEPYDEDITHPAVYEEFNNVR